MGEYLGADRGLGVAMVVAQQQVQVERTWGLAVATAAIAGVGSIVVGVGSRRVVARR